MRHSIVTMMGFILSMFVCININATEKMACGGDTTTKQMINMGKIDYFLPLRNNNNKEYANRKTRDNRQIKDLFFSSIDKIRNIYIVDTIHINNCYILKSKEKYYFLLLNKTFNKDTFNYQNPLANKDCYLVDEGFELVSPRIEELAIYYYGQHISSSMMYLNELELKKVKKLPFGYTLYEPDFRKEEFHVFAVVLIKGRMFNMCYYEGSDDFGTYAGGYTAPYNFIDNESYYILLVPIYEMGYNHWMNKMTEQYQ